MRVTVDLDKCMGHARCQEFCPEVYGTDEVEGKCRILVEEVPQELRAGARLGARNCPEAAIRILENRT